MYENDMIARNVASVRAEIGAALKKAGREADAVRLIAVTKTATADVLPELLKNGVGDAAENRWQVARDKFEHPSASAFDWHFIGPLQTNKLKYVLPRFSWIHAVDRLELAQAISDEAGRRNCSPQLLLQVNVAREPQKHGFAPEEALAAAKVIAQMPNLSLRGLMTMAPLAADSEETRPVFRGLYQLWQEIQRALGIASFDQLSMGMSNDFGVAVEEGATMVRIGRSLVSPSPTDDKV